MFNLSLIFFPKLNLLNRIQKKFYSSRKNFPENWTKKTVPTSYPTYGHKPIVPESFWHALTDKLDRDEKKKQERIRLQQEKLKNERRLKLLKKRREQLFLSKMSQEQQQVKEKKKKLLALKKIDTYDNWLNIYDQLLSKTNDFFLEQQALEPLRVFSVEERLNYFNQLLASNNALSFKHYKINLLKNRLNKKNYQMLILALHYLMQSKAKIGRVRFHRQAKKNLKNFNCFKIQAGLTLFRKKKFLVSKNFRWLLSSNIFQLNTGLVFNKVWGNTGLYGLNKFFWVYSRFLHTFFVKYKLKKTKNFWEIVKILKKNFKTIFDTNFFLSIQRIKTQEVLKPSVNLNFFLKKDSLNFLYPLFYRPSMFKKAPLNKRLKLFFIKKKKSLQSVVFFDRQKIKFFALVKWKRQKFFNKKLQLKKKKWRSFFIFLSTLTFRKKPNWVLFRFFKSMLLFKFSKKYFYLRPVFSFFFFNRLLQRKYKKFWRRKRSFSNLTWAFKDVYYRYKNFKRYRFWLRNFFESSLYFKKFLLSRKNFKNLKRNPDFFSTISFIQPSQIIKKNFYSFFVKKKKLIKSKSFYLYFLKLQKKKFKIIKFFATIITSFNTKLVVVLNNHKIHFSLKKRYFKLISQYISALRYFFFSTYIRKVSKALPENTAIYWLEQYLFLTGLYMQSELEYSMKEKIRLTYGFIEIHEKKEHQYRQGLFKLKLVFQRLFLWLYGLKDLPFFLSQRVKKYQTLIPQTPQIMFRGRKKIWF